MGSVGVLFVGAQAGETGPLALLLVGRAGQTSAAATRPADGAPRRRRLHQLLIRTVSMLVQEYV